MVGAGDIARCAGRGDEATARLLDCIPGTVFTTGDNVYESGTAAEFKDCYGPSWGQHRGRTLPVPGNHGYETAGAAGYFGYFGARARYRSRGYYSYDRGRWHVIALNSMCERVGGCGWTSPMHDHDYERFAPQKFDGTADARRGIREFVVGTGGGSLRPFKDVKRNSSVRNASTYGVLRLTLNPSGYSWRFVPVAGKTFTDSGTATCH